MSPSRQKRSSRITITDVARQAGVSISTVSRVLNQSAPVTPELESKVQAVIDELGYRPQTAARVLAGHKTRTIGLLLSKIGPDFYPFVIRGIESAARERQFKLLINVAATDTANGNGVPFTLGEQNTDGVLVFPASLPDKEIIRLHKNNFPIVLVQRSSPPGFELPSVTIENRRISRKLVDHLIEVHGYQRIAFLAGPEDHEDAKQRKIGYRESLDAHNIPFRPELYAQGNFRKQTSQDIIGEWLLRGVEFDAVFACDDRSAVGVMSALHHAGLDVPEDVAVVGFDDAGISRYLSPPLTTVHVPIMEIGRVSAQMLIDLVLDESPVTSKEFETELVIRRSCGCS